MKPKNFKLLLVFLFLISIFTALPILELRGEEPRRALVALEMILSDNFMAPTIHGENYYNKPPLFNWMLVFFFRLFNSFDEWVVRLPSALGFISMGFMHFFITKKYVNKNVAFLSTLFFFTSVDIFLYSSVHAGEIDLFYSFIVYAQIISLFIFYEKKKYLLMYFSSYLLMAAGFLTKGVPSLAFQGVTILAMALFNKDLKIIFRWQHFVSGLLALLLIFIYFWKYNQFTDAGPFIVKLFNESSEKSAGGFRLLEILKSAINFPLMVVSKTLPWSLLIIVLFIERKKLKKTAKNKWVQFSILFVIANIVLYWFSPGVRIRYLYMFFPFFSVVLAYYVQPFFEKKYLLNAGKYAVFVLNPILLIALVIAPFLPITKSLSTLKFLTPFLILLILLNIQFTRKNPRNWILSLAFIMIVIKLEMNLVYWPLSHQKDFRYKELIEKSIEISENNKLYLTGNLREFPNDIKIGPVDIFESKNAVEMPPFINYKIPFYITLNNMQIMEYCPAPQKGYYYISAFNFFKETEGAERIKFADDNKIEQDFVIFKIE